MIDYVKLRRHWPLAKEEEGVAGIWPRPRHLPRQAIGCQSLYVDTYVCAPTQFMALYFCQLM